MNFEQAIKDIQDTLVVMAEIERRQAAITRENAEHIGELLEFRRRTEESLAAVAASEQRLDVKMEELTDKLNGLIGYIDGQRPPLA